MSDVFIKDMKMPKNCKMCAFCDELDVKGCVWFDYYCRVKAKSCDLSEGENMPDWCPLVEVPTPHGRLIDADFEEAHYASMTINPTPDVTEQDKRSSVKIIQALKMAKTVIPAERSE